MSRRSAAVLVSLMATALAGTIGSTGHTTTAAKRALNAPAALEASPPLHQHGQSENPGGHEGDEGLVLRPSTGESVDGDGSCPDDAVARVYEIVALAVDITLNRYGDHDPQGRMYALASRVDAVRNAERRRAEAVTLGLQGDAIQPLVLRVRPGECLRVRLTNELVDEPASFHLHASSLVVASDGTPAVEANPAALAEPGATVEYEWMVGGDEPEGTHVFHSHGDTRVQSGHGLFGALVVEPPGSTWTDPRTGDPASGWDAVVEPGDGASFREFVVMYHEIGDENYFVKDAENHDLPQVDPTTNAYRPGSRALNYRSEPFLNRLQLGAELTGRVDESLAYSSFSFGDPATPIQRTYVGDPVKERVVHAGPEVFHVHHVHGGSVRWRRQPGAGPTGMESGVHKHHGILPGPSERTDSQTLGPSETFDVEHECSAGGCQQGAGDYLVHCHIAHHYFAGMWGIWRVYDTLQDGPASTDALPPLPSLPDRLDAVDPAVPSDALAPALQATAADWLPPSGAPKGYDASVWDWTIDDGRIVGQPETTTAWPGYESPTPGQRPPILFDPRTGRPAYPMLRPHLADRPPFAPGHGPSGHIDRPRLDGLPAPPGVDGPGSLCPEGTTVRSFSMRATELPVPINDELGLVDPAGVLFVLAGDEAVLQADPTRREPLAIRANAGEDCLDVTVTNAIPDNADHPFSKISAHIHFVQFDVQTSDGVDTGFNYEQTVRPFAVEGVALAVESAGGASSITVVDAGRFSVGAFIGIGIEGSIFEIRRILALDDTGSITLDRPLDDDHPAGATVSTEFVRQRWYPDAQVGTAYFHDHVNGIRTWQHGLVGAVIVEPPGATYHDPTTGEPVQSGTLVDVRVSGGTPVSADVSGSFREFVAFIQEPSKLTNVDRSPGANINLRAEPLGRRDGPVEQQFSSTAHGDPATPLMQAYVGDPIVMRTTVGGTNEIHTWHVDGHWFRDEPWSLDARPVTTTHLGISERKDVTIPAAGGPQQQPGDYLYVDGRALKPQEGAWGLLRVLADPAAAPLAALPGHEPPTGPPPPVCPDDAPVRTYAVVAVEATLPMQAPERGQVFVEVSHLDAVVSGAEAPTPLVLRANVGDCLEIALENRLPAGAPAVSLHADGLAFDPSDSGGVEAGFNPPQTVAGGATRRYTFFAHPQYGAGAAMLRDGGDLAHSGGRGLYGAVAVAPEGATFDDATAWSTVVHLPDGTAWRDVVLFTHDEDDAIGTHRMPYTSSVRGAVGLNYGRGETGPVVEAFVGDPLQLHVLAPWSEQAQVFSLEGHRWPIEPAMAGSTRVASIAIGGLESITIVPDGGAGGEAALPGTYWFGDHREPYREAGLEGSLIVHDRVDEVADIEPLTAPPAAPSTPARTTPATATGDSDTGSSPPVGAALVGAGVLCVVALGAWRLRSARAQRVGSARGEEVTNDRRRER